MFIYEVRKIVKQPKSSTFEIKIFDFSGSPIYKIDENDEKQLQEIGPESIALHRKVVKMQSWQKSAT